MSLFRELKRRNVFRVAAAYVVMSWLLLQIADVGIDAFDVPSWAFRLLILFLALGLIPVVIFAWVYEMTPEGIKKESEVDRSQSVTPVTGRKLNYATIAMVVIGIAFVLFQQQFRPGSPATAPMSTSPEAGQAPSSGSAAAATVNQRSIAVLPFVNMSSDPENEYFADGLSEELLNQLAQLPDLLVAGRTSSFSFKGKNEDLREIGRALGVANVLEGSVRRQGDRVRVTAQIIRVSDGFHLWSNTYDRTMDDVFAIQDDISSNVAKAMKIVLDETARQRMQAAGIRNVDAFIEYQKGHKLFEQAHAGGDLIGILAKGVAHYDRAIELAPDFGAAYWNKSDYYAHLILDPGASEEDSARALEDLRATLDAAYELSEDPERRAFIDVDRILFSDDWTPLHDRVRKALATTGCPDPSWIELATPLGYAEAAGEMWARYQRCEPLSTTAYIEQSVAAYWQDEYETALDILIEAEQLLGESPWLAANQQRVLLTMGRSEEALALAPEVIDDLQFFGMGAEALPLAMDGDIEGARLAMERWLSKHGRNLRSEMEIYAALGDRDRANELAAQIDAHPGGAMLLLISGLSCACGSAFDLEATPNFRERMEESGTAWPLVTHVKYPAKDW